MLICNAVSQKGNDIGHFISCSARVVIKRLQENCAVRENENKDENGNENKREINED